jgi:hypothetical protein
MVCPMNQTKPVPNGKRPLMWDRLASGERVRPILLQEHIAILDMWQQTQP